MIGLLALSLGVAHAQAPEDPPTAVPMSVEDALRRAQAHSTGVDVANAQLDQAEGDIWSARSGYLPSVTGSVTYQRTFASEFDKLFAGFGAPPPTGSTPITSTTPPTTASTGTSTGTGAPTGDAGGGSLPFGQPNTWRAGFQVQQGIYGGGRTGALNRMARAGERSAEVGLEAARAQSVLDTATAYFDAAMADRMLAIATGSLSQAQGALRQTELGEGVGRQPEFDLLRARVVVDNQRVAVINSTQQRDFAHLRLLQLLDLPPDTALELTSPLEGADLSAFAAEVSGAAPLGSMRAPVRQLTEAADISEASVIVARADALPSLGASANLGWVSYPTDLLPLGSDNQWYASTSAMVALSVPLFNGGRLYGGWAKARGAAAQTQAQVAQTTQFADLDAHQAQSSLTAASAQWSATEGVVEQAQRAYDIAELRFNEGVSTQLELSDARLQLEQALANRTRAARDLAVAQIRIVLLSSLPL